MRESYAYSYAPSRQREGSNRPIDSKDDGHFDCSTRKTNSCEAVTEAALPAISGGSNRHLMIECNVIAARVGCGEPKRVGFATRPSSPIVNRVTTLPVTPAFLKSGG